MKKTLLSTILTTFLAFSGFSQTLNTSYNAGILQKAPSTPILNLTSPDLNLIRSEDSINDKMGKFYRIGVALPVNINTNNSGRWTVNEFGERIWQLEIKSSGAEALSFPFEKFYLYDKATIDVFDSNGLRLHSTYTAADVLSHGQQNLALCFGDQMTIQIKEPVGTRASEIQINEIMYAYRSTGNPMKVADFGDAGSCQVNVNCSPEGNNWQDEKRGVVRILSKVGAALGWGTGSLMNNTSLNCSPLILTSMSIGLNGATFASTSDLNQWIFYFNYEAASCANPGSQPSSNTITGCVRRAYSNDGGGNTGSDFLLVQLNSAIPASYNVYYNGWDANNTATTGGVGIHHPAGDIKKISTFAGTTASSSWGGTTANTHWALTWAATTNGHGVMEGGSTGSPIFKNSTGQIVGTLTGGGSSCTSLTSPDAYGKMSYHWASNGATSATRLKDWLDPGNTGTLSLLGSSNPCSTPAASFSVSSSTVCVGQNVTITDASSNASSWVWDFGSNASPASASGVGPHVVSYSVSGVKTISLTINGTTSATQTIIVSPLPTISVNSGSICTGNSFTISPVGAITYTIQGGSAIVTPTITASYSVIGVDANGCLSAPAISSVAVNDCTVAASALNFDGVNDRVSINNPITNSFTLETYIKTSTPSATGSNAWQGSGIIDSDVPGVANDFILSILNNRVAFWDGSSSVNVVSTSTVTDGAWKHVALTRAAGGQIKLYINGVLESTGTAGGASLNANPLIYFGNNFNAGTFTNISMDETRIWNRVLCQAEIQNNMNGELPPGQYGLLSYYKYNQGIAASSNATVTTLNDASGNANNGTLSNFALTGTTSNWVSPGAVTSGSNVANYASATISISGVNSICSGSSTTFTASGAVSSYTWNTGSTTSTISVTPTVTTTYSVVGTNSVGCISNVATKTLTVNALPTASITGVAAICAGQTTTLTATGGGTYAWSTGATTPTISVSFGATYTATITNVEGCSKTAIRTVMVNPLPTASISGANNICEGKSTTLTASGGGTYLWNTGANTAAITVSPLMTTPYTVTVTSASGCTSTATRTVTVHPIPTGTITGNTSICAGQSTTLTASGGVSYMWTNGANTSSIVVSPAINTIYGATVTSVAGCTVFTTKNVVVNPLPTPTISGLNTICVGQITTFTASGGSTYLWSNGATTSTIAVSPTVTTAYTATVTSAAGCTATATRNVNVNNVPIPNISGTSSICEGQSTTLTASGGTSYIWNTGANTAAISVSPTLDAAYTVTVTNASGCKATAVRVVTVNAIPTASITGAAEICTLQSTILTASGGTSYVWSTGANTPTINISPSSNTAYTVTVTSAAGCTATAVQVVTVNPLPTPVISGLNNICVGEATTLTASGGGTYLWSNGASTSTIAVSPAVSTAYTATVTSAAGCTATATRNVNVNSLPTPSISGTSSICEGQSTTLIASGGGTYMWNTGEITSAITVSPSNNTAYTATVTNASGCKATAVRVVTVNAIPTASITGNTSICAGQTTTLTASGGASYVWSTGANTSSISVSPFSNATYVATVTSVAGCTTTVVQVVTVNPLPTPAISGLNNICVGQTTTLTASGGSTYLWSNGATTSTIAVSPTVTTAYTATVTSAAGCTATATRNVNVNNVPIPNISGTSSICEGQSTTLTASGGTSYIWNTGANTAAISVSPTLDVAYTVTVTNASGCKATAVRVVTVNTLPVISVNSGTICSGESFTISPSGADTYTISGGSNVVSPTVDATYNVTGTDANGCVSSTAATSSVVVNALPVISVNSGTICSGASFTISPSGADTYTISGGSNVVSPTVDATYNVTGTDANGCVSSTAATSSVIVNALPVISVNSGTICSGESFTISPSGADTYTISGGNNVVSPTVDATYNVTGTDANGCVSSTAATSSVVVNALPVISVNSGTICSGESFTISPSGADTYTISGGSNVVSPTVDATYNVTGTDANGCVSSTAATSSVVVNALPVISVNSGTICSGESFTISPSGADTYTISGGSNVVSPTVDATYNVTGTDANGCVSSTAATSSVVVNALPVISVNSGTICSGESFTISPSGADTYTISGGSNVVSPTVDATYNVTGTDANGCVSSTAATSSVIVNALPTLSALSSNTLICVGETVTLTVSGASSYTWSTNENTTDIVVSPTITTSYSVSGADINGCINSTTISQDVSLCTNLADVSALNSLINIYPNPSKGIVNIHLSTSNNKITVLDVLGKVIVDEQFQEGIHSIDLHSHASGLYFIQVNNSEGSTTIRLIKE